jgi:hypothetical protein
VVDKSGSVSSAARPVRPAHTPSTNGRLRIRQVARRYLPRVECVVTQHRHGSGESPGRATGAAGLAGEAPHEVVAELAHERPVLLRQDVEGAVRL